LGFGFAAEARQRIAQVLAIIGLEAEAEQPAAVLSHGQTQWLELGLLMIQNPKLILLDEPTAGMTAAETRKTAEIIRA
ncbi:ATP-binding cassette domain-containing protein, partial [Acinetobacter baumannii]